MKTLMNLIVVLIALVALVLAGCEKTQPSALAPEKVQLKTEDGVTIYANFYKPKAENPPAVLLLHQRGSNKEAWGAFIDKLVEHGFAVMAIDMRGHGESTKGPNGEKLDYHDFNETAGDGGWWHCKYDAEAAVDWLTSDKAKVNKDKIAIVGASVGCSIAAYCTSERKPVTGIVMLSPVVAISPAVVQALASLGENRKVFIYYCKGDERGGDETSAKEFDRNLTDGKTPCTLHGFDGKDHGMDLLGKKYGDFDVNENILKELDSILK